CPDALWGHVLRSPHAHALIKRIDISRASKIAGVRGIYTAADLAGLGPMPCLAAVSPLIVPPRFALAVERVRHVGDPVAFIVADTMDLELTGQGLHGIRRQLAEFIFKMPPERIRLHAPDVGGGFGTKNFLYPEWILLLWAARKHGRPVRWEADRSEEFVSSAQGRDIAAKARLGLDKDGRFLALDIEMVANHGAYLSGNGPGAAAVAASTAHGGVYDIPAIAVDIRGAFTNTVPVDAYRGAGKPEANYIVERCIEAAAPKLGRDPASLRRQNLIASFPHKTAMGMAIDSGGFVDNLDRAVLRGEVAAFEARRAEAKARGKLRGIGVACFLETSRGAPNEGAEVRFETDGRVTVAVGTESNGQ